MSSPTTAKMSEKTPSRNTAPDWLASEITTPISPNDTLATIVMMIDRRSICSGVIARSATGDFAVQVVEIYLK